VDCEQTDFWYYKGLSGFGTAAKYRLNCFTQRACGDGRWPCLSRTECSVACPTPAHVHPGILFPALFSLPLLFVLFRKMALPGTETVRFRRPTTGPNAVAPKAPEKDEFGSLAPQGWKRRHQGLLQDKVGR